MLISDQHRFILVRNRRVAGTSMRRRLAPFALPRPDGWLDRLTSRLGLQQDYRRYRFRLHAPLAEVQSRMPAEQFADYFKFSFVRNPWDRLVSEYEFIRGFPGHSRHRRVMAMDPFREFVEFQIPRRDAHQIHLFTDGSGELMTDFLGRYENLAEDFDQACQRIGLDVEPLPHLNPSKRDDYRRYYDDETADLVARHWADEIERFGYSFE